MKVYVVVSEYSYIVGVYDTKEFAKRAAKSYKKWNRRFFSTDVEVTIYKREVEYETENV